jgi:hypothetical protein
VIELKSVQMESALNEGGILKDFFNCIRDDGRIGPTHISVFAALINYWQQNGNCSPIRVYSFQVMEIAKIASNKTYHKCIRDLHAFGVIRYEPSFKKNQPSRIFFRELLGPPF